MDKNNKKNKYYKLLLIIGIILLISVFVLIKYQYNKHIAYNIDTISNNKLEKLDLSKYDKLMIVAHPDDESLWGGSHLLEGGWFVVCITNGTNDIRKKEFMDVMEYSKCTGLILDYPDKVNGVRDDWSHVKKGISKDINKIISSNHWKKIVTHNPDGEYGHQHHILTSAIVTKQCTQLKTFDKLYYFGKYYKKKKLKKISGLIPIHNEKDLDKMLSLYTSQKKTVSVLHHMVKYEMWVKAADWR